MKIQCFLPCLNESDILPHTLLHLHEQGCVVHVIDGWSIDGSWEIAQQCADSVERFPAAAPDPINHHAQILERIEHLAEASDADWCLYSDADEWRRSPVAGQTLAQGVIEADKFSYNAIDFRVFQFYCIDEHWGWMEKNPYAVSPEDFFHYYDEADCISRIPNRKLWKNVGRVHLAGGGHEVMFPGMRVYPRRFTMKHFPFRTPAQAKAKIETRLARRCAEEHAKGWGSHYDRYIEQNFTYCWDPSKLLFWEPKLLFWEDTRSPLP